MNRGTGMFLVFIALILLTAVIINGLYFDNSVMTKLKDNNTAEIQKIEKELITVNLNINSEREFDPEIVDVFMGVESKNQNLDTAVAENNKKMTSLLEMLENEDLIKIETEDYRVYPISNYNGDEKEVEYQVVNRISFRSENLEGLPIVLNKALQQGANQLSEINYKLKDEENALDKVTALALDKLKKKAEFLQKELGKDEYEIRNINFGGQNIYSTSRSLNVESISRNNITPLPIKEEKVEISVNLSAEILLK